MKPSDGFVYIQYEAANVRIGNSSPPPERACFTCRPIPPDFNPIEQAWSKIKQWLRSATARSVEALESAIAEALPAITADNALTWLSHCGYGLQQC